MKAAVIDIGTNSCRLLAAEKKSAQSLNILARELMITRLGEGVDQNRRLKEAAVKRVIKTIKNYKEIIERNQIEVVRIIGTSALRDVKNPDLLVDKNEDLGFILEIISGEKEARLNYRGAASKLESDFLLIDIGGGSTEFVWPDSSKINFKSLDIGCVRMTEKFISNPAAKVDSKQIQEINNYVRQLLEAELNINKKFKVKGVGGTITTLAAVKLALEVYDSSRIENLKIIKSELEEILDNLSSLTLRQRKKVRGLQSKRADIIVAGLVILKSILEYINIDQLYVTDHDLLYGLLKEELNYGG